MKLGIVAPQHGPAVASPRCCFACARAAEEAGLDDLWVADHLAIPPDDAEGSNGRYLDPLADAGDCSPVSRGGSGSAPPC